MGPAQATDPNAMPLDDFIAAAMHILRASPDVTEICVDRAKPFRSAETNGIYSALYKHFNDSAAAGHAVLADKKMTQVA
jgi:uncharacterized oxidoreductase